MNTFGLSAPLASVCVANRPALTILVEDGLGHSRIKFDLAAKLEPLGDRVGVSQDFRLGA